MSWSVGAQGKPEEVKAKLADDFSYPLADGSAGLDDASEKETVRLVKAMIEQCLGTFDPTKAVTVSASGHMGFDNWDTKAGAYQEVSLSIRPGS
jgi:hypothetical protein